MCWFFLLFIFFLLEATYTGLSCPNHEIIFEIHETLSNENGLIWMVIHASTRALFTIQIYQLLLNLFCRWERKKNDENKKALEQHHQSGRKYDERSVKSVNRHFLSNEDVSNEKSTADILTHLKCFKYQNNIHVSCLFSLRYVTPCYAVCACATLLPEI